MAIRTDDASVKAVIDYDTTISSTPFIATATALVDHVATCDTAGILSTALLKEIETYLAAHFYALRDQQYRSKKTGNASAKFQGKDGMQLNGTDWGQQAIALDISGCLSSLSRGKTRAAVIWLGAE